MGKDFANGLQYHSITNRRERQTDMFVLNNNYTTGGLLMDTAYQDEL